MFLPLPFFWTLFDQQSSRWVAQADLMDPRISFFGLGEMVMKADQMQVCNSVLILALIPLMEKVVYPLVDRTGFKFSPLRRMVVGMALASFSFFLAAILQLEINKGRMVAEMLVAGERKCVSSCTSILWQVPQYFFITAGKIISDCFFAATI